MIPPLIVQKAVELGIGWIAITDHNASANIEAVIKAAEIYDLAVTPGIELQTREDVHALALFDTLHQVRQLQTIIDDHLPDIANNIDFFGEQFIVDETGDFIAREERLLISSLDLGFSELSNLVNELNGLFIPAHVNRKAFGLLEILGFIPSGDVIDALEITRHLTPQQAIEKFPTLQDFPIIQNGDVHNLEDFLGSTQYLVKSPTTDELRLALFQEDGRTYRINRL